jgi:hypothetical protein
MTLAVLKDTIKDLAKSLQASTIFPAAVFVLTNIFFIAPKLWPDFDSAASGNLFLVTILTVILSYTLYALNIPLIRLVEGYVGSDDLIMQLLKKHQRRQHERLKAWEITCSTRLENVEDDLALLRLRTGLTNEQLAEIQNPQYTALCEQKELWTTEVIRMRQRLDSRFPSRKSDILAMPLGNVIAAFEDYSFTRYGMDSVVLWPRLVPILKEKGFLDLVAQEKSVFDFLLNLVLVAIVIGFELFYWSLCNHQPVNATLSLGVMIVFVIILYQGCIFGAELWGTAVRVAFDLYRDDLHKALRLKPCASFGEEYSQWKRVSQFLHYGNRKFGDFLYRPTKPRSPELEITEEFTHSVRMGGVSNEGA